MFLHSDPLIFTDKRFGVTSNYSLFDSFTYGSSASEDDLNSLSHSCAVHCNTHYGISCYGNSFMHSVVNIALNLCFFLEPNVDDGTVGSIRLVNSTIKELKHVVVVTGDHAVRGVEEMELYVVCKALGFNAGLRSSDLLLCAMGKFLQLHINVFAKSEYGDSTRQYSYGTTKCYEWGYAYLIVD